MNIIDFVDTLISDAYHANASDIHIDPKQEKVIIRIRSDGLLEEICQYPIVFHNEVIARLKVMSNMRLDEHFIPQDGRIHVEGEHVRDIRIVITPSYFGEAAVLRILRPYNQTITLESLGFSKEDEGFLNKKANSGNGLYIVAGPTGSGKTTTLYAIVSGIISKESSVISIEDPIEYILSETRQIAVNHAVGFRFPEGLRSVLRQDPDVIIVGEIRDSETARIAVSAALTGHRVFATIHTNSADEVVTRFIDMGIERYMIEATLKLVVAQRLVRCLCIKCVSQSSSDEWVSSGCIECREKGYAGRTVVYELVSGQYKSISLIEDGIKKSKQGKVLLADIMSLSCE